LLIVNREPLALTGVLLETTSAMHRDNSTARVVSRFKI